MTDVEFTNHSDPQRPRLSILHLMLVTFCVGAFLGYFQVADPFAEFGEPPAGYRTWVQIMQIFSSLLSGAAVSGFAVLLFYIIRHVEPSPLQPGHYLLVIAGSQCLPGIAAYAFYAVNGIESRMAPMILTVIGLTNCIAFTIVAIVNWKPLRWRAFFLAMAITSSGFLHSGVSVLIRLLGPLLSTLARIFEPQVTPPAVVSFLSWLFSLWGPVVILVWLAIVCLRDHRARWQRDWLHWIGVFLIFGSGISQLISNIGFRLIAGVL